MNYQNEQIIETSIENPEYWMNLIEQPNDFQFMMNKEILQAMINGFEILANEKAKEYYFEHQKQHVLQMDKQFSSNVSNKQQTSMNKEQFDSIVQSNKQLNTTILQNTQMIDQLNQTNQQKKMIIQQSQNQYSEKQNDLHLTMQMLDQELLQARNAKEAVNTELDRMVNEHNVFVQTYDELYQTYAKYKHAYETSRVERDELRKKVQK